MAFGQIKPTQSTAGPVATGQSYAQQIAGGMPMEQVIAPGVSYSPKMAGGYTQADLDLIAKGPAPVLPSAPTKGTPLTIEDQMLYAPPGVKEPTKFMPFLQNLDFSNLPRYEDIRDIRSFEDIRPTLFDIDIDVEEMLKDIDTEKLADIDIPSVAPVFPEVPVMPSDVGYDGTGFEENVSSIPKDFVQTIDRSRSGLSGFLGYQPEQVPVPVQEPMNFTGLPQMPVIPNIPVMPQLPVMPQPIVPQPITEPNAIYDHVIPTQTLPQNIFANTPKPQLSPMPVMPNVEDIVKPISRQGKFLPTQPRLFSF